MSKRPSSSRWLQRQHKDQFVKQARQSKYRSRAVYKLMEIDEKDRLFHKGQTVIDLGAAPGSWSQYVNERIGPEGKLLAVDILPLETLDNALIIQGDFTEAETLNQLLQALGNSRADLVISDMSPNISGIKDSDQARSLYLAELARDLAFEVLKPGGDLLIKIFQGAGIDNFRQDLKEHFEKVFNRKPRASRADSSEIYLLGRSFRC